MQTIKEEDYNAVDKLNQVLGQLKKTFVGKDNIIDLMGNMFSRPRKSFPLRSAGHCQKCHGKRTGQTN
jgi:hypothetical protein